MTAIAGKSIFDSFLKMVKIRGLTLSVLMLFSRPGDFDIKSGSKSARDFAGVCGSLGFPRILDFPERA